LEAVTVNCIYKSQKRNETNSKLISFGRVSLQASILASSEITE